MIPTYCDSPAWGVEATVKACWKKKNCEDWEERELVEPVLCSVEDILRSFICLIVF